jgi:hypothetical protein
MGYFTSECSVKKIGKKSFWCGGICCFFFFLLVVSSHGGVQGEVVFEELLSAFPAGLLQPSGKPVYCEASAVVLSQKRLFIASDRKIPGYSPVFSLQEELPLEESTLRYQMASPFLHSHKIEDMAISPDQKYCFAVTGFDRIIDHSHRWNPFSSLIYWHAENPEIVSFIKETPIFRYTSSVELRQSMKESMKSEQYPEGPEYFKIEGLAVLPNNLLLLGIREKGNGYRSFEYCSQIIAINYRVISGEIELVDSFRSFYQFYPEKLHSFAHPLGLSSLEYDSASDSLFIMTSMEMDDSPTGLRAYLWKIQRKTILAEGVPDLLYSGEKPLCLTHKGEGLAILESKGMSGKLFIVHDDDRNPTLLQKKDGTNVAKKPNQFVYSVINWQEQNSDE